MNQSSPKPYPELIILAIATLTRFWRLDYHSFWFDEAITLRWAVQEGIDYMWPATFRLLEEKHPPAYYTLLKLWHWLLTPLGLNQNDTALRASGALLGVLTVLGVLLLARRISGRITALLTGLFVALSPVLVWYSQELRMFQPATTGIVWAAYCLARAWWEDRTARRILWWIGMIVAMEFALYSYLFSAFMLPAMGLALIVLHVVDREQNQAYESQNGQNRQALKYLSDKGNPLKRIESQDRSTSVRWPSRLNVRRFVEGTIALSIVGVLFLPLARNAWGVNAVESAPATAFANFIPNTRSLLKIFTIWRENWPDGVADVALMIFGILLLLGFLLPRLPSSPSQTKTPQDLGEPHRNTKFMKNGLGFVSLRGLLESLSFVNHPQTAANIYLERLWLLVWIGTPLLIANLLLSRSDSIFAEDRYLLFMAPFVLWVIAAGVVSLGTYWRIIGWVMSVITVLLIAFALPRLWTPDAYRENWRAAANYIDEYQQASPGLTSAAVAHLNYTHRPMDWYLQQRYPFEVLPVFGLFGEYIAPDQLDEIVGPPIRGIPKELGAATLWLTQSHLDGVDDDRNVERWISQHYPIITEQSPRGINLTGYALKTHFDELPALSPQAVYPNAELAPGLHLFACEILNPQVSARDTELHPPSGWVHVRLWWQATEPLDVDYLATAQVIGPEGVWGERLDREGEVLQRFPTSTWDVGQFVRDEVDINLNPETPTEEYSVVIGMRDDVRAIRRKLVHCGQVTVTK
ncbi:glycosyltransferase family 39 protein [Chloroflexi bacterium TSY]|nr:glycosyltransferase family 39 protein [Chloroflexi bacterium TSY]